MVEYKKGSYGYHCRICGEFFQHLWGLSSHHNNVHSRRIRRRGAVQWTDEFLPQEEYDKKASEIRKFDRRRRLSLGWVVPKNWHYVRVWKIGEKDGKLVIAIEPLLDWE